MFGAAVRAPISGRASAVPQLLHARSDRSEPRDTRGVGRMEERAAPDHRVDIAEATLHRRQSAAISLALTRCMHLRLYLIEQSDAVHAQPHFAELSTAWRQERQGGQRKGLRAPRAHPFVFRGDPRANGTVRVTLPSRTAPVRSHHQRCDGVVPPRPAQWRSGRFLYRTSNICSMGWTSPKERRGSSMDCSASTTRTSLCSLKMSRGGQCTLSLTWCGR